MAAAASFGAAAAVPALAEQVPIEITPSALAADNFDRVAMVARAEQLVEFLGSRYIREGWHESFDRQRAAEFVESGRRLDLSADYREHFATIRDWMHDHGQSFDWMIGGDPSGMIGRGAKASAKKMTDDPIFAAIGRYRKAYEKHDHAIDAVAQYREAHQQADGSPPRSKDHPVLKNLGRRLARACVAAHRAACDIVLTVPTTRAGVQALVGAMDEEPPSI